MKRKRQVPRWVKIAYTVLVVVVVAFYAFGHGMANFLWFSNVALLTTLPAIWLELRLVGADAGRVGGSARVLLLHRSAGQHQLLPSPTISA